MSLISRSILSSSRRLPKSSSFFLTLTPYQNTTATTTNNTQQTAYFSTSPDYTNYESWHKNNYEDESHTTTAMNNASITNLDILQNNFDENSSSSSNSTKFNHPVEGPRTSVLMELTDRVGALHDVLRFL